MINFFSSALQKLKKEDESNIKEEDQAIDSIAKLFIAGIIPGIMIAFIFMLYVIIWSVVNKKLMPSFSEKFLLSEKIK